MIDHGDDNDGVNDDDHIVSRYDHHHNNFCVDSSYGMGSWSISIDALN